MLSRLLQAFLTWFQRRRLKRLHMRYSMGRLLNLYLKETIGYYLYYPEENKVFDNRNGEFLDSNYLLQEVSGNDIILEEVQEPKTKQPFMNFIILRAPELVVKEVDYANVVEEAPAEN
ncbi:hypothetical protein Tco_1124709 [Tanacetum coccineum]|uniref:Uncharacterized protein n=1 Tax=Tanacetum coccineum TaxID=301880 RepID=A0ABQ5JAX4_9ASTR